MEWGESDDAVLGIRDDVSRRRRDFSSRRVTAMKTANFVVVGPKFSLDVHARTTRVELHPRLEFHLFS